MAITVKYLEGLGVGKEVAEKIFAERGAEIEEEKERYSALEKELKESKESLENLTTEFETLKTANANGDIEEKILSMYAKGMTTSDIESHTQEIYGLECSDSTISRITDKILPVVREWQSRPLEEVYAVVFMDAIHFHVRSEGQIVKKAVYVAIPLSSFRDISV